MRFRVKTLLICVAILCGFLGFLRMAYVHLTRVEMAENVPHVDWLPAEATNVSYYKSYQFTAYEFDISERGFLNWTWLDVQPIESPVSIERYTELTMSRAARDKSSLTEMEERALYGTHPLQSATISNGYYCSKKFGQKGGRAEVAYDRSKGRAYFQTNPR